MACCSQDCRKRNTFLWFDLYTHSTRFFPILIPYSLYPSFTPGLWPSNLLLSYFWNQCAFGSNWYSRKRNWSGRSTCTKNVKRRTMVSLVKHRAQHGLPPVGGLGGGGWRFTRTGGLCSVSMVLGGGGCKPPSGVRGRAPEAFENFTLYHHKVDWFWLTLAWKVPRLELDYFRFKTFSFLLCPELIRPWPENRTLSYGLEY